MDILYGILENELVSQALKFFGLVYICYKILPIVGTIFSCYIAPGKNIKEFGANTGAWAVITGCTDGIGKELTLLLAKEKFNLVLISRTQSKLDQLKEEISKDNEVEIKTLALDFAKPGVAKFEPVKQLIKDLPIHVLINNVGKSHEHPKYLEEEEDSEIEDILNINVYGTLFMTKLIIPVMKKATNSSDYSGLIMNIGSFAGLIPTPLLTTYSSSKSFLQTFSAALGPELEKDKILVTNIIPYFVVSKLSKFKKSSFLIPTAESFAKTVLNKIGVPGGSNIPNNSTPYFPHAIIHALTSNFANLDFWIFLNKDQMVSTRKRALRKKERESQEGTSGDVKN
ncbi:NAD(P)-binding protein [Neoconidiobolus thromboides FSU 785]|nr:NAD(P)-binding protein [Neoconidiobolus thromboides FSU 785]